jgi:hypothetical protein
MNGRQCTATSHRTGERCKRRPILGGNVCPVHGGSAPQVIAAARRRLEALVDPAIDTLADLLEANNESVALQAAKDILDRTGHKPSDNIQVSGPEGGPVNLEATISGYLNELRDRNRGTDQES